MPTPHVIENSGVSGFIGISYYDFGPNQDLGPWEHGGRRYVAYCRLNYTSSNQFTAIASTSDGSTFTVHDPTNAPQVGLTALLGAAGAVCADNAVSNLYTCYYDLSGHLSIVPFNLTSNLYGAVLSGGPAVTNHVIISSIRMLSTGVLLILYGTDQGANGDLRVVTCTTGGSWGSPVTVAAGASGVTWFGMSMVPIVSGKAWIQYFKLDTNSFPNPKQIRVVEYSGGSLTGDTLVETATVGVNFPYPSQGTGRYDAANDRVLFPFRFNFQSTSDGFGLVLINSASTSPSVAEDIVLPFDANLEYPGCYISLDGSTYFFTYEDYNTTEQVIVYQRAANSPGTWTGPTTFWDYDTDPPPVDPANPGVPTIEENPPSGLVPLSSGNVGTLISFFGGGGASGQIFCNTVYYMESGSAPPVPTLQLTKTVVGGTSLPTDFIVTATGPDTISGAGGVGPATVTAGIYALSETGPANYTSVWNCGVATMPTATSVVVPSDGTPVVCTLTNTFNPVPPPPPTPPDAVLRYQIPQRRWFPHAYADHIVTHYLDEAEVDKPNDMQLLMLSGTHIMKSGGNTDNGADVTALVYLPSNDGGDERAQKLYVDTMVEADQTGDIISQVRFNNGQQIGPGVVMSPTGLREQFLENISSLADLSLYRNIMAVLSWTGGPDGPRIYAFEPSGFAQPYVSTFFVTQFINLAYPGWKSGRRFYPAIISNFPVLLTIKTQDDRVYGPYSIPSTGGQFRIIPMILNHGVKDLAFAFQLDGQGRPFALFPGEFTVELKGWSDPDYIDLAIFRT